MEYKHKKLLITSTIFQILILILFQEPTGKWIFSGILWFITILMWNDIKEDESFLNLKSER